MLIKKINNGELEKALQIVNKKYGDNIIFNNFSCLGNGSFRVTLKVKDCKKPGHRLGFVHTTWETRKGKPYKQRRLASACWHVHGDYFDALFSLNREIVIRAGDKKITVNEGNWEDRNIGSLMNPLMFSEACECKE